MPAACDSGNGFHLLYPSDLPPSDAPLLKSVLVALAECFDSDAVEIDKSVFNASRITKLYGTRAAKGDSTADRPHRLSRMVSMSDAPDVVTREQLEALAGQPEP